MTRYVEAAVNSEIQTLRCTSSGRACATFRAAAAIGGFVGAERSTDPLASGAPSAALETGLRNVRRSATSGAAFSAARDPADCSRRLVPPKPQLPGFISRQARCAGSNRSPSITRPPQQEVVALWGASLAVGDDAEAGAWFVRRFGSAATWFLQQTEL